MHTVHTAIAVVVVATLLLLGTLVPGHTQAIQVNKSAPTARGLVAWWKALPGLTGSRSVYDLMGLYSATLTNMTGASSGWVTTSRPGSTAGIKFDGADDYVSTPASTALQPPEQSILFWAYMPATASTYHAILSGPSSQNYLSIFWRDSDRLAVYGTTTAGADNISIDPAGSVTLPVGAWVHIAVTYGASTLKTFINCQPDHTAGFTGTLVSSGLARYWGAAGATPGNFYSGLLDDMRIYNRALPAPELCTIMRESLQGEPSLLRPPLLALSLPAAIVPTKANFMPWFQPE